MNKNKNIKPKGKIIKSKSDINAPNVVSKLKVKAILVITLILIILLIARIFYLQFVDGEHLQTLATSQQTLTETLSAKRGTIYDSKGETLAISYNTDKIYLNRQKRQGKHRLFLFVFYRLCKLLLPFETKTIKSCFFRYRQRFNDMSWWENTLFFRSD